MATRFKYMGEGSITLRHMTFESGKSVEVTDEDLARKISVLPYFQLVKPGRPKNGDEK